MDNDDIQFANANRADKYVKDAKARLAGGQTSSSKPGESGSEESRQALADRFRERADAQADPRLARMLRREAEAVLNPPKKKTDEPMVREIPFPPRGKREMER